MRLIQIGEYYINLDQIAHVRVTTEPDPNSANKRRDIAYVTYAGAIGAGGSELLLVADDAKNLDFRLRHLKED